MKTPSPSRSTMTAFFADAGTVNDSIRAGQYAGYILNSITHFAAESAVDETLTFINTKLQVIG